MMEDAIDVVCPKCSFEFQVPLGQALTPLIDGEIERQVNAQRKQIVQENRAAAAKESDERNQLAIEMKDKIIADMRVQIDELRRKADSGSQQLQGEIQELALERMLRAAFPADRISPIEKGRAGGDAIHEVVGLNGAPAGVILWECKQTKEWSKEWLSKAKQDMRAVRAALCVIATATLPKGVDLFERVNGVFVVSLRCVLPLAQVLRQVLIDIAVIKAAGHLGDSATNKLFSYITGQQFHHRLSAVMEGCVALQGELDADKRSAARRWARTQQHIDAVLQNTGAVFGDLQGLLGRALPQVAGLEAVDPNEVRRAS